MRHRSESEVGHVTCETGVDEPVSSMAMVFDVHEHSVSDCEHGCKYYMSQDKFLVVLGHNSSYGCKKTKRDIRREHLTAPQNRNAYVLNLKNR